MGDRSDAEPPQEPPRGWLGLSFSNDPAGLLIFKLACISILVLILIVNFPFFGPAFDDYKVLRSFELLLSVAGLGLIVSFLAGTHNIAGLIFGFLVVAALIVPTRDLIRFALIATGSERSVESYYGSSSVATNISGRVSDIAKSVTLVVEDALLQEGIRIPVSVREDLITRIQTEIQNDRILSLIERVKARGVFELLSAIEAGNRDDFVYRNSENDRLTADLAFLRYEDLVSVVYDDISTAVVTPLGRLVVQREARIFESDDEGIVSIPDRLFSPFSRVPPCESLPVDLEPDRMSMESLVSGVTIDHSDLPKYVLLTILPGEIGRYGFSLAGVDGGQSTQVDPMLAVYKIGQSGSFAESLRSCELVGENDDGSDGLNSRLEMNLRPGDYLVRLTLFDLEVSGQVNFRVLPES